MPSHDPWGWAALGAQPAASDAPVSGSGAGHSPELARQSLRSAETHSGLEPIAMAVYSAVWLFISRDRTSLPSGAALISLATPST